MEHTITDFTPFSTPCQTSNVMENLLRNGGPDPAYYQELHDQIDRIADNLKKGKVTREQLTNIYENVFDEDFMKNTLQGHSFTKPYGYAGDYKIIDMIYQNSVYDKYGNWDRFYHDIDAAKAVRNRKAYFKNRLSEIVREKETVDLLDIASGPARDLFELYAEYQPTNLVTHCLDTDPNAIAYAQQLTRDYKKQITFERADVNQYETERKYDVIWSAGLFNYFDDATFVKTLKKILSWTKHNSELIIGNFAPTNPSKNFMEVMLDWYLCHRDEKHLIRLAVEAGVDREKTFVGSEPEGVNLFLHIKY